MSPESNGARPTSSTPIEAPSQAEAESSRVATSDDIEVGTYLEIAQKSPPKGQHENVPIRTETIAILDFGSQYTRLIARRVREANVYCEIIPLERTC